MQQQQKKELNFPQKTSFHIHIAMNEGTERTYSQWGKIINTKKI